MRERPSTSSAEMTDSPFAVLALQAHDELGAQDVELALQDAAPARDLALFGLELGDQRAQLVVRPGDEVDDVVHGASPLRA